MKLKHTYYLVQKQLPKPFSRLICSEYSGHNPATDQAPAPSLLPTAGTTRFILKQNKLSWITPCQKWYGLLLTSYPYALIFLGVWVLGVGVYFLTIK